MNHLIMGQGQNKVFVKGIEQCKSEIVHVIVPVDRVLGHKAKHVVHPAHVPFKHKAQATKMDRAGDTGPGSGLLGYGHNPGKKLINLGVKSLDKINGL